MVDKPRPGVAGQESADEPRSVVLKAAELQQEELNLKMFLAAYSGSLEQLVASLKAGGEVNFMHPEAGLCALHVAVGANDFGMARCLIEECGASFFPDGFGRWPSLIAAECEVDDELGDYIAEQEARYMKDNNLL